MTTLGITMENAFKQVQTCLVLVKLKIMKLVITIFGITMENAFKYKHAYSVV